MKTFALVILIKSQYNFNEMDNLINIQGKILVAEIIGFYIKDEKKHYEESPTENHIYLKMKRLKKC